MADIELVIKIPKGLYEVCKGRPPMLGDVGMDMIAQVIANGTPLPKRHGRLIDADALILGNEDYRLQYPYSEADEMQNRMIDYINDDIHQATTIIEENYE